MKILAVDDHITDKLMELDLASVDAMGHAKLIENATVIPSVGRIMKWFNNTRLLVTNVIQFNNGEEVCVFGQCIK